MPVSYRDVLDASTVLEGHCHKTPTITSRWLDELSGATVFLKCENFQRTGSFKFRGAFNALSRLTSEQRANGVLTFSSGNHAQALALAGRLQGISVTVVMPIDAPKVKLEATKGYGGEVVLYDRDETAREEVGARLASERGLTVIPPYDHVNIIAGQGTSAKEFFEEVGGLDALYVPCGGGGLLSGSSLSAAELAPKCHVLGVEPRAANDAEKSFRLGKIVAVHNPETIADGARTPSLGEINFEIIQKNVFDIISVSDEELLGILPRFWERTKILIEPTGALGVAGLLSNQNLKGKKVGVILSGGNADFPSLISKLTCQN